MLLFAEKKSRGALLFVDKIGGGTINCYTPDYEPDYLRDRAPDSP